MVNPIGKVGCRPEKKPTSPVRKQWAKSYCHAVSEAMAISWWRLLRSPLQQPQPKRHAKLPWTRATSRSCKIPALWDSNWQWSRWRIPGRQKNQTGQSWNSDLDLEFWQCIGSIGSMFYSETRPLPPTRSLRSLSLGSRSEKWRLLDQSILHPSSSEVGPFSIDDMTFSSWQTYQPYCVFLIHSHVKLQGKSWCPTAFPFKNHSIAMLKNPQGRSVTACHSHLGRWHDGGLERVLLEKTGPSWTKMIEKSL